MFARLAALLALAGALALPTSLFLRWYEIGATEVGAEGGKVSMTGWEAFETTDLLLVIVALVAVAGLLSPRFRLPRRLPSLLPLAAAVAAGAILLQIIEPPPLLSAYEEGGGVHVSRELGAWLALGAAVLLFLAGLVRATKRARLAPGPSSHS